MTALRIGSQGGLWVVVEDNRPWDRGLAGADLSAEPGPSSCVELNNLSIDLGNTVVSAVDKILDQALELSAQQRLLLAQLLLGSISEPPGGRSAEEWKAEVERRIISIEQGSESSIPWESVREEMRALISRTID